MKIMIYISVVLVGIAVFYFMRTVFLAHEVKKSKRSLPNKEIVKYDSIFLNLSMPAIKILSPHLRLVSGTKYESYLSGLIVRSGYSAKFMPVEFVAFQIVSAVLLGGFGMIISVGHPIAYFLTLMLAGFIYPIFWIRGEISERKKEIDYILPGILDLLSLSVEAGLDFISAIQRIAAKSEKNLLVAEFEKMLSEIKLGKSRIDALAGLKNRLSHRSVNAFVSILIQAQRLGSPIGPVLKIYAEEMRVQRFQSAERAGVIAAQKILFPLIFCIMPAVFIIVFGPLVVMWKNGAFERMLG